jgi:hypothetical protein
MTTGRMISSDIFEDDFVGGLSFFERLVWIGAFGAVADDQGRLLDSPVLIRSKVFLYDASVTDDKVDAVLVKLATAGKISRYQAAGKRLIQIVHWWKYQKPSWASPSKFPAPPHWQDRIKYHTTGNKIVTAGWDYVGGYVAGYVPKQGSGIEEVEGEGEGEVEGGGFNPCPDLQALGVLTGVTGMLAFPGTQEEQATAISKIRTCMIGRNVDQTVEFLKPFYNAWRERKYSKVNLAWLDWALAGEIPEYKPKDNGKPKTITKSDAYGNPIEVPA